MSASVLQILRDISMSKSFEQYQEISEESLYSCVKQSLPHLLISPTQAHFLRDKQFYSVLKLLSNQYMNAISLINSYRQANHNPYSVADSNQKSDIDFGKRKTTRAMMAMRNVKNQEELKKDQIFVRAIPRSQNCIAFMLNNKNFPRIEVKLSCNQHLEYLTNFLTNKWLRGKVGVGYQIVLYPDSSLFLRRFGNQEGNKRSDVKFEPLNNYLMFTDIMAAYGNSNHSSLNLYYDIVEFRKEKNKIIKEREVPSLPYSHFLPPPSSALKPRLGSSFQEQMMETPLKSKLLVSQKNQLSFDKKVQNSAKQIGNLDEDMSMGAHQSRERRSHHLPYSGNFDEEDYGSLAFNWNHYNSNLASNFFNNNSNTFLNHGLTNNHHNNSITPPIPVPVSFLNPEGKNIPLGVSQVKQNQQSNNLSNGLSNFSKAANKPEDKLSSIRNFINMIEKQGGEIQKNSPLADSAEKEENSIKQEVIVKKEVKQVKVVPIFRKKNQNQ